MANRRFVVIGSTGSGKTTVAADLARRLDIPHVELDALHWGPNWTPVPDDIFRQRVLESVCRDSWVVDGNYQKERDIVWPRATIVVWLDYPFRVVLRQLVVRTFGRARRREVLWSGNQERLRIHFFSRDSLFLWLLQTHWRYRREYPLLFSRSEHSHLAVVRLRSPKETKRWLDRILAE